MVLLARTLILVIALFIWPSWAESEEAPDQPATADRTAEQKKRWDDVLKGKLPSPSATTQQGAKAEGRQLPPPQPPAMTEPDAATVEAYRIALREYYNYQQKGLQHRQRVFLWQHYSSITIFVVVILLVAAGIYFAAAQFHHGLRSGAAGPPEVTQLEAGTGGLKVSSPVLGVIILVISLAFFYLYLAFVYPIQEIF